MKWTGEKFGSAKTTLQTEDFQRLEVETERKRIGYEKLHAAAGVMQVQLAKKKISPEDNKSKRLPNDILGVCLSNYGNEFTDDAPLGVALINFGQAQSKLAAHQEDYAETMRLEYMEKLEEGLQQFKEYAVLRKRLESRRLDYDAKIGRLQKSKKEKPDLEQEMQASKLKYEDSEYDVIQKMATLQEFEDEHCEALAQFLNVQYDYFNRSLQVLNEVRSTWGQPLSASARHSNNNRLAALSRTSSHTEEEVHEPPRRAMGSRSASFSDEFAAPPRRVMMPSKSESITEELPMPSRTLTPPVLPRRQSQATPPPPTPAIVQRKAVYEFGGDNADELSFRVGDVITVLEEVDEGWWLGESADGRRGIFPVNYTELIQGAGPPPIIPAGPPMPARPSLLSNSQSFVEEPRAESPFGDAAQKGYSYIRPNQPTRTMSSNTNTTSSPINSPVPRHNTTKRAPPPPPVSRTPPVTSSRSFTTNTVRTAPTTPQIHLPVTNDYFEASSSSSCGECGCDDFTANVFKKGHCNNCFHKH
ncbi:hypothetical protein INT47_007084 [Mucor saturninus]|uniref:BAR-domain-containing protein n=1 Tax=Mucor saturninus TaxID=64648 RepID=A0A8H7QNM9_9FUNG|nr:hypothetical protein INT47_007084 [Mucor saturninus]